MSPETMLVRVAGGDVVRRKVESTAEVADYCGRVLGSVSEPELNHDEMLVRFLDDPIPTIIKVI